jgi:HEAT repeat-containing protein 5
MLMCPKNFFSRSRPTYVCTHRQIYVPAWLQIIDAVAVLVELESENIFEALNIRNVGDSARSASKTRPNYRDEPVAFFFVIYGLCFQTLLRMINNDDREGRRTIEIILGALKKFLRPSISGNAMYKGFVFAETTDLLDRLVLMESPNIQLTVIHIAANLAKYHPNSSDATREMYYQACWIYLIR